MLRKEKKKFHILKIPRMAQPCVFEGCRYKK